MPELAESERGWFAGIVDGDGSIIMRERSGRGTYHTELKITNGDDGVLDRIEALVPDGNLYSDKRAEENDNASSCYHYVIARQDVLADLLPQIIPHLAGVKQRRAELLLEYVESRLGVGVQHETGVSGSVPTDTDRQDEIYDLFCAVE